MRIHHVAFRTRDLARLEAFYGKLGFDVARRQEHSVWLRAGDAVLMLERAAESESTNGPTTRELVAFATTDALDTTKERLRNAGIVVEAETKFTVYFRDPDGRRLGISRFDLGSVHS